LADDTQGDSLAIQRPVGEIPSALADPVAYQAALAGRMPALFLDYDGTLTPIVDRPELAVMSDPARAVVDALSKKVPVAVVSGRDRPDVERLVGLKDLIYAGSHGFDIRAGSAGEIDNEVGGDFTPVLDRAEAHLHEVLDPIEGALVERKKFSIAAHYRLVSDADYPRFRTALDQVEIAAPELKEKTGKKVFELQPKIDWDKGKCVLYLCKALGYDGPDYAPMFFGDDVTDEDAFSALKGRGVSVICADPTIDPDRQSFADFRVDTVDDVIELLRQMTPG
jgi:trehalose 6-phosphate phosphatase